MIGALAKVMIVSAGVFTLAACGERPQVVNYKQGTYQGKPDTPPFAAAPFNGNQQQWETAIRARNVAQNEYKRIGD